MKIPYTLEIDAPPERVWEVVCDPENQKNWMPGYVSNEHLQGERNTVGSTSKLTVDERGSLVAYIVTVTEADRPRKLTIEMLGGPFRTPMTVSYAFEDLVGRTRLDYFCEVEPSGRMMALMMWLCRGMAKKTLGKFMRSLKALAEDPAVS